MTTIQELHEGVAPNIAARFFATAAAYSDRPAMGMAGEDAFVTYRQMVGRICECIAFLGDVAPLEPIGLFSENRPAWGKAYLAILAAGGMVVPIDSLLKEDELRRVFIESGFRRLFVSHRFIDMAEQVAASLDDPVEILDLESIPPAEASDIEPAFPTGGDDAAALIFTSGTTGSSKKVILTHNNILADIDGVSRRLPFGPGDRFLSVLPLHHTFEATCGFIVPMLHGCEVYYIRELNSREIFSGVKKHAITHFISVPLLYEKLYHGILNAVKKAPPSKRMLFRSMMGVTRTTHRLTGSNPGRKLFASLREKAGLASIRMLVSGGAPMPPEIARGFHHLGFDFVEGYGMTETSPVLTAPALDRFKCGSVGPPLDNVTIRIDRPDDNGVGEICARGPMITPGYDGNPEATADLIRDGWLYTGDLGRLDRDGYLYIMGRAKNLIVSAAGKNIYPEEIESELTASQYILEALVYGHTTEAGREEVAALIYPDYDALAEVLGKDAGAVTPEDAQKIVGPEIKEICSRMADFKRIKHVVYRREEMEKTSTRKIKRYLY